MPAKSLELKHTIKLIQELDSEIDEIENEIKIIMDEINSPILSIPGINYRMEMCIRDRSGTVPHTFDWKQCFHTNSNHSLYRVFLPRH